VRDRPAAPRQRRNAAGIAVAGLLLAGAAQAQWSVSIAAESDYRFRGVSLGGGQPSLRLGANFDGAGGWYAGASATQSQFGQGERYAQWLGYAGYVRPIAAAANLELGAIGTHFAGNGRYDFAEAYAGLLFERWSLRLNYSPRYFGRPVPAAYLDASGRLPLDDSTRLFGHAGLLAPLAGGAEASRLRTDVQLGLGRVWRDLDLTIAWSTVTRGGPFPAAYAARRSGWVAGASWFF
jgi:uncharacterized protein (TIGR02001 family)